jgi:antitoxin (DNA-binding transcriptional repressor) of toxin-antitoxin stability system
MQTIKASVFKVRCLALIDQVARTGTPLLVTQNGTPIAELHPHHAGTGPALGILKNQLKITGDVVSPLNADWDAPK